jgi:hypothetical protein
MYWQGGVRPTPSRAQRSLAGTCRGSEAVPVSQMIVTYASLLGCRLAFVSVSTEISQIKRRCYQRAPCGTGSSDGMKCCAQAVRLSRRLQKLHVRDLDLHGQLGFGQVKSRLKALSAKKVPFQRTVIGVKRDRQWRSVHSCMPICARGSIMIINKTHSEVGYKILYIMKREEMAELAQKRRSHASRLENIDA